MIRPFSSEQGHPTEFLIVTAVKVELAAVLSLLTPSSTGEGKKAVGSNTYYFGTLGRYRCAVIMTEAGSGGTSGSTLSVSQAISDLSPGAVIMVGIAFGRDPAHQQLGDLLVSTQVIPYELQRHGAERIPRSPRPEAGPTLLNRARNLSWRWERPDKSTMEPHFGPLLSGEKLVDHQEFKQELFEMFPHAIGGEMEAAGIAAVCQREKREWLVAKAICDWADGTKKKDFQETAAKVAAAFLEALLREEGIATAFPSTISAPRAQTGEPADETRAKAAELVAAPTIIRHSKLSLGGEGGRAPGAGGGGGGAIGAGVSVDNSLLSLGGGGGQEPGAGGGGGGAIGPGAKAGRGGRPGESHMHGVGPGEGGEGGSVPETGDVGFGGGGGPGYARRLITTEAGKSYPVHVGRGGLPGFGAVHAQDGEATIFGDELVRADGAKGGKPGYRGLEPRNATLEDSEKGLRVTSMFLGEAFRMCKCGTLLDALGAGWDQYVVSEVPIEIPVCLAFAVDLRAIGPNANLLISVDIRDAGGVTLTQRRVTAWSGEKRAVVRPNFFVPMVFTVKTVGLHKVTIASGEIVLGALPFEVKGIERGTMAGGEHLAKDVGVLPNQNSPSEDTSERSTDSDLEPRFASAQDVENGLRVTSMYLADVVQWGSAGKINALGAGWEHCVAPAFPIDICAELAVAVELSAVGPNASFLLAVDVVDDTSSVLMEHSLTIRSGSPRSVAIPQYIVPIRFAATEPGVCHVIVRSGGIQLATLPFEVRLV